MLSRDPSVTVPNTFILRRMTTPRRTASALSRVCVSGSAGIATLASNGCSAVPIRRMLPAHPLRQVIISAPSGTIVSVAPSSRSDWPTMKNRHGRPTPQRHRSLVRWDGRQHPLGLCGTGNLTRTIVGDSAPAWLVQQAAKPASAHTRVGQWADSGEGRMCASGPARGVARWGGCSGSVRALLSIATTATIAGRP